MTVHVIDANVVIHGGDMDLPFDEMVTVPAVTGELSSEGARRRFDRMDVSLRQPGEGSVERVEDEAARSGVDLSETDVRLVALACEEGAVLVTDDYAMQNVADRLDVEYEALLKEGIEDSMEWKRICRNCGRDVDGEECRVCGAGTKRVPRRG